MSVPPADSFMFIIGELGTPKMETRIDSSANPTEALRQYNNTNRAARAAIMCVVIFVPAWRRLAVNELVRLWLRSRKLYCRMRFGINMAYNLDLPCYVAPQALRTAEAQKTMPHVVARCVSLDSASATTTAASTTDLIEDNRKRKRSRRPSAYDTAVADHVVFGDLSPDNISATLEQCFQHVVAGSLSPKGGIDSERLDILNTLIYRHVNYCFTLGKESNMSKRGSIHRKSHSHRRRRSRHRIDRDDEASEDEEDDEDDEESASAMSDDEEKAKPRKKSRKATVDRVILSNELEPAHEKAVSEMAMYATTSTTIAPPSTSTTAKYAGDNAKRECSTSLGIIDDKLLVSRAEDCFSDSIDYLDRPTTRVRLDKTQHCVCGARDSFVRGRCRECYRTAASSSIYRTDLAWLKEQATERRSTPGDRRTLRKLMIANERDTPIDIYSQTTFEQLRGALAAQQPSSLSLAAARALKKPKETRLIRKTLQRAMKKPINVDDDDL
jgi:hypothetical protein